MTNRARTNLIDRTVGALRAQITSGQWPVGTRIPPEPELVELLGVGRNTVREAVGSLVHAGMLARRQGSGTYVLSNDELASTLSRQVESSNAREVLDVRRALEVEACRLAALRRDDEQVAWLWELHDRRAASHSSGNLDQMVLDDFELHRAIFEVSGNKLLFRLYDNLVEAIAENIRHNFRHSPHSANHHTALIAAIAAGDSAAAVAETHNYLAEMIADANAGWDEHA